MLKIRLFRIGKKHQPVFRVIVTDKKNPPRGGRFLEILGFWNPLTKEKNLKIERIKYWLSVGAKPSDTVYNLLISEKIIKGKKIDVHKKSKKKEESASAKATADKEEKLVEKSLKIEKELGEKASQEKQTTSKEAVLKEEPKKEEPKQKEISKQEKTEEQVEKQEATKKEETKEETIKQEESKKEELKEKN